MRRDQQRAAALPQVVLEPLEGVEMSRWFVGSSSSSRSGSAMTSRASEARVCSPPDSAVGGLAHSSRANPSPLSAASTRWSRVYPPRTSNSCWRSAYAGSVDAAVALELGERRGHPLEVRRAGRTAVAQVRRRHERPRRSGPPGRAARSTARACGRPRRGPARRARRRAAAASSCRRRSGPTRPMRSPSAIGAPRCASRMTNVADLAGDLREPQDRHQRRPRGPRAPAAAAAARRVGGARRLVALGQRRTSVGPRPTPSPPVIPRRIVLRARPGRPPAAAGTTSRSGCTARRSRCA